MGILRIVLRALASALLVSVLAAGASGQSRPVPESRPADAGPAGVPDDFAPLFKFCPAQIESVMCLASAQLPEEVREFQHTGEGHFAKGATPKVVRSLHAGRKFATGGDYEGVSVFQVEKPLPALGDVLHEEVYRYVKVESAGAFVRRPLSEEEAEWGENTAETWVAAVDRRFLIFASRRAVLQEVLAGRGPLPETCVERLGWKTSDVDWNAPIIIVRKYDPTNKQDPFSPVTKPNEATWPATRGIQVDRILLTFDPVKRSGRIEAVAKESAPMLVYLRELMSDVRTRRPDADMARPADRVDLIGSNGDRHSFAVNFLPIEKDSFRYGYGSYGFGALARIYLVHGHFPFR